MIDLVLLAAAMGVVPRVVCEVGVNDPEFCSVAGFRAQKILVEPLAACAEKLRAAYPDALVYECCVGSCLGQVPLFDRGQGSWIVGLPSSPDMANNGVKLDPRFVKLVDCLTMDRLDPGNIDVLAIDTEGAEWWAIAYLVSRPKIIRVETHLAFHPYQNPFRSEIERWMAAEGYRKLCETVSDSVYVRGVKS